MKKLFRRKKKSASEAGSIGSGLSGSAYNISPKKDLGKLHKASFEGDLNKLKSLLKRGDVNQLDKENRTPLHLACANGKYEAVRMICEHHNINLNLCDNERRSALMKCVQCEHSTCLNILLQKEADVSLCDINGNTALHIAASIPNSDICYLLSDYHADPCAKNKDGATALSIAAGLGSDEIVKLMLESGVNINDSDSNKRTSLMLAAHNGKLTTVQLLLSKNSNAALRDIDGFTADDHASMNGHHSISTIIVDHSMKKGNNMTTPSKQSTISRTPQTTPQKLGVQGQHGGLGIGGPAMDVGDDLSQSDDSQSASRITNDKDGSWASSDSEEEPAYAQVNKKKKQEKPKINILKMLNIKKKSSPDVTAPMPITTTSLSQQSQQSPSKATTSLFLTSSAREEIKKQESVENDDEILEDRDMRTRYDSKSARGQPVSPTKPPLPIPKPRSDTSLDKLGDSPGKYSPEKESKDSEESGWDSNSGDEEDSDKPTPAMNMTNQKKVLKPNENLMQELGFDEKEMKDIYDESDTDLSRSEAAPVQSKPTILKKSLTVERNQSDDDSWDDDSFSEKKSASPQKGVGFNFMQSDLKFDDETDSDEGRGKPVSNNKTVLKKQQNEDDSDSSWNSENLVKRPEHAPSRHSYVSSPPSVLQDAEKIVSPEHRSSLHHLNADEPNKKSSTGIVYGQEDSDSIVSDLESESSWEEKNRLTREQVLNNQKDVEKEEKLRQQQEEERQKIKQEEERRKKEMEEQKILEERRKKEEDLKRKQQEEERRKQEEKQKEELEKMNRMNEELQRKNTELSRKKQEEDERKQREDDERRKREEEKTKLERAKSIQIDESLREALERAADDDGTSESGESNTESNNNNEEDSRLTAGIKGQTKSNYLTSSPLRSAVPVASAARDSVMTTMNQIDLDTLTEETETDDDLSLSEAHPSGLMHSSPLSDSLKLAEEKQNLSMQLAREQETSMQAQDKLDSIKKENKQLRMKERVLIDDKKAWELEKVEMNADNRKLSFDVKNLQENLETINLRMTQQDERCKRLDGQLQIEKKERKEHEVLARDLRIDLKNSNAATRQAELDCEELKKKHLSEMESRSLAKTMNEDSFKLNETLQSEAMKDKKAESLEQVIQDKNQELIKAKAERDRYEDTSARYKEELVKLRSLDTDLHGNLAQLNQDLNDKLDEKEEELRESEEALQLTALQSVQYKQAYENNSQKLTEERHGRESILKDLDISQNQQMQLKNDLEDSRSSFLREQERNRKLDDSLEKMREKESVIQDKLLSAEKKSSGLENELQISKSSNKQRVEDTAKIENELEKLRETLKENEKNSSTLQRENAEQSGKIEAFKMELQQRESECTQMRQEREDLRSRSTMTSAEQQEKFNSKLTAIQKEHENERVAFETRNVQLAQQIEHWKSESDRIEKEKAKKDDELAQAQQDRIEAHKRQVYSDAFSKNASKEQKQLMDNNAKFQQDNIKLQSQVSLLEQKLDDKSSTASDLQREVDKFYQTSANANRQIDSLSESQRIVESNRAKLEQQLKDVELENIRLKSELDSSNSWKDRLQQGREEEAHAKASLEEKVSRLQCDKVLVEGKMATESANLQLSRSEVEGHKNMWETEVKARSKLEVELAKIGKESESNQSKAEQLKNKLTRAMEDRKTYKTKYEQLKRDKLEADKRAESYRSAMHDSGRKAADMESDCESQISLMDEQQIVERGRLESTIAKLREQVTDLAIQVREKKKPYFPEGPSESNIRSDEVQRATFENEKLKEELRRLKTHVESSYVDRSELDAARQEERIKAQAALAPTLDQVNSYLKDRQIAQDVADQLRLKNEEHRYMQAVMKIASLEEELVSLRRKNEDSEYRIRHHQEAELSHLYDGAKKQNDVLQQQLSRSNNKADEYKSNWIKERKKFQNFFSNTMGGSIVHSGLDVNIFSATNGFSPGKPNLSTPPIGAFTSTPKKDPTDPILNQLRNKLDASIAQHLSAPRQSPMSYSAPQANGHLTSGSSASTPRSDRSSHPHQDDMPGTSGHKSANEYMSFLLT